MSLSILFKSFDSTFNRTSLVTGLVANPIYFLTFARALASILNTEKAVDIVEKAKTDILDWLKVNVK
jgi:hypothetical protein